jgi:hypothetical protein
VSQRIHDVIVIGCGPYGLAAAAQLRGAGVGVHVIGSPMSFWNTQMPRGMCLRSPWSASHIGEQRGPLSLYAFERTRGARLRRPIPIADFIAYGHWVRERAVPDVDERHVDRVERMKDGFRVLLEDGETLESRRLVVAAGISPFASRPAVFDGLPPDLASHSSEHADLARFAGERVAVIGGGQSATESTALLHESGADVEQIMRGREIRWVGRAPREGIVGRFLFDRTDVGPALLSHFVARPMPLRRMPTSVLRAVTRSALEPGASLWLRKRMRGVPVTGGRHVTEATRSNGRVALRLDDGTAREVDHVLLATGYRVDIAGYRFLAPALVEQVRRVDGHPVLDTGFQSSVPGLHFIGAPATHSFGPLVRFVSGTEFAARALVRAIRDRVGAAVDHADQSVEIQRAAQQLQ